MSSGWDTDKRDIYAHFRRLPFDDMVSLVEHGPRRILDLGCGTAALTKELHDRLGAIETVAMDSSEEMLARARVPASIRLVHAPIETFEPEGKFDMVVASASLQWVANHGALLERIASWLAPHGQLVVQMPARMDGTMRAGAEYSTTPSDGPTTEAGDRAHVHTKRP